MKRIPIAGPWITDREVEYVADAARTAWYSEANKYHERFERAFGRYVGRRYAIALPSCTAAIHLALLGLGVGAGDEVIVPDVTWIASSAPITYVGATPVFADIDVERWCLSPAAFEECITPRTRAVVVVDLYGNMPDMAGILEVAARHGIAVIEDAAEAIGSEQDGQRAGSFGDVSVFSFHGSKTLTTGEGGMLVTDRQELWERILILRDHGRQPGDSMFVNSEVAFKYKMSSMQAALGLAQIERIDELIERKRLLFHWYEQRLSVLPGVQLNYEGPRDRNSYWMVTAVFDPALGIGKDAVATHLAARGIDTRPFFNPLSDLPAYAGSDDGAAARERNANSYRLSPYGINLPSALNLTEADVEHVCAAVVELTALAAASA